ncbi:MAG TPA: amino acid permease [Planctomycetes bacterium]|nr:amino acid permease [Planctomycetota bacterium]
MPSLVAIVVANMIGAGVFTTSGFALADLGSPNRVMIAWVLGGIIALLGALCYGSLAGRLRESGGEYLFLSRTLHPMLGFLAGWVSLWAGFTGAIALAAQACGSYLEPMLPVGISPDVIGTAAIAGMGFVHSRGLGPGALLQNLVVAAKLCALVLLVAIGASALPAEVAAAPPRFELGTFAVTLMWVSLSYSGWNAAVYIAGEAREPGRSVPRALRWGTLVTTLLYLALNWVFVHAAAIDELAGQPDVAAVAARALGGSALESFVRAILVLALVTSISSMVMIAPRVYARMAEDGLFPSCFAFRGAVPAQAIWLQVGLSTLVLWSSGLRSQLTNLGWILGLFTALSVIGLLRLRAAEGPDRIPIPGFPFVPLLFLALVLALSGLALVAAGAALWPAIAVLVTGLVAYRLQLRGARRVPQ